MYRRYLTALFILALAAASLIAATVRGRIIDSRNQPLPGATATLFSLPDTVMRGGEMTDEEGCFYFPTLSPARYLIRASMIGMEPSDLTFEISDTTKNLDLPAVKLYETSTVLKELVVSGVKAAVVVKTDTIEFNADSFHTTDNAMVEDLLKKLPGVEVDKEGSITSGGEKVTKILVNGKEYFEDDPKMASKNLSAKMVDKVQVVKRKSEQARLTGVDDGDDEMVINLTVKRGMENCWFGNVSGSYGTTDRYNGQLTINRIADGNMVSIIANANNINNSAFTDMGRSSFTDYGGNGGINATQMAGINFNVGSNDEKFRIGGNVSYNHSDRVTKTESETTNLLADSVSYKSSKSDVRDIGHNVSGRFRMRWNIDDYNTLDFQPQFTYNNRHSTSHSDTRLFAGDAARTAVNSQVSDKANHGNNWTAGGNLTYVHRFASKDGRSLSFRVNYNFTDKDQRSTALSDIEKFLVANKDQRTFRYTDNHTWNNNVSARATYIEPIGRPGNFLEFAYSFQAKTSYSDKYVYDLPDDLYTGVFPDFRSLPEGAEYDEDLSNRFRNVFLTHTVGLGYRRTTKKMNLNAGVELTPSTSKSENLIDESRNVPKRLVFNYAPYVRFRYKFGRQTSVNLRYMARSSQPSMTQLQPVIDVSNPLNVKIGNPDLKPTFTQRLFANFNDYNEDSQRSLSARLNGSYVVNNVVSRTETDKETGGRTTRYTNTSGDFGVNFSGMYSQPFRNRNWRVFVNADASYNSYNGYINNDYNVSGNLRLSPRAGITFSTEIVQVSVNPTYSWQLATNTLENQKNTSSQSYGFNADLTLNLPFGLQFDTRLDYSKTTGLSAGFDSQSWLWNADLSYTIPKTQGLNIFVKVHDILGDTKNIVRTVSAASIVDSRYNDLSRYIMFGLSWQFNSLNLKKKKTGDVLDEEFPLPGQGPGQTPGMAPGQPGDPGMAPGMRPDGGDNRGGSRQGEGRQRSGSGGMGGFGGGMGGFGGGRPF